MAASERMASAIRRGEAFLEQRQLAGGNFAAFTSTDPAMAGERVEDPSVFPTCLIAYCLSFSPSDAARRMRRRAEDFLLREMDRDGLWRHWPRQHPNHAQLPADLDDTSCASAVLRAARRAFPDNRNLLLANRRSDGLFFTWFVPRLGWRGVRHARVVLSRLRHPLGLLLFFRKTASAPGDVDAVVNANLLHYLGASSDTSAVVRHLLAVLRAGGESQCDKWYEDPFAVWYFFSRSLAGIAPEAGEIMTGRIASSAPATALQASLAIAALNYWEREPPNRLVEGLLDAQLASGAWPCAALYHGGRARLRDGSFAAPHPDTPRWGSEELTTAFAIEALSLPRIR